MAKKQNWRSVMECNTVNIKLGFQTGKERENGAEEIKT